MVRTLPTKIKCPLCHEEFEAEPIKEWKFQKLNVKRFKCPLCGKVFNAYFKGKKLAYTIPKG